MTGQYDTQPTVPLPAGTTILRGGAGWRAAADLANRRAKGTAPLLVVDAYPGTDIATLTAVITDALPGWRLVDVESAARPAPDIDALIAANLTDDRVFGVMSHAVLDDFYDADALSALATAVRDDEQPTVIVGWGAALLAEQADRPHALVLVDMARWEIQQRLRAGAPNWHADNPSDDVLRKYKRGYFIEWRVADRHKRTLLATVDFVVDGKGIAPTAQTAPTAEAGMITGASFREALADAVTRPFRVVPFFDPGVWGGQWMKAVIGLDPAAPNYAWGFDCVPEENSLLLEGEDGILEIPAMDLVLSHPVELLGAKTHARFGAEFPIRFDFLDTMDGGNLSLQVHPLTDYIQNTFGMHYTQDESYYLLDAGDDAVVYLGTKEGIDRHAMLEDLERARTGGRPFPVDDYINAYPARKHDHFAIPAGTVHCSGANSMVLEISATPYIFTFKLWDWGRVGLDGIPRPVHLDHGARSIQWDRDTKWVSENLIGQVDVISDDGDVREERTGLHELEFIEVRRHWFSQLAEHDTDGTLNVLNLVEGDEVQVSSPDGSFPPFVVRYAETFIVPAAVGPYRIERTAHSTSERFATVKAFVRGTGAGD